MKSAKIEHLVKVWREACQAVQITAANRGDSPEYASAIEYRDSVAQQTLGLILKSLGICDENGETL